MQHTIQYFSGHPGLLFVHLLEIGVAYDIDEHRYRFAVWAAGRAYARGGKDGAGCTVSMAKRLIVKSGLGAVRSVRDLPERPTEIDRWVFTMIARVRLASRGQTYKIRSSGAHESKKLRLSYGRAQKLVNMYLKAMLVCGGQERDSRIRFLHPPIDGVLLDTLAGVELGDRAEAFRELFSNAQRTAQRWTKFQRRDYVAYLDAIKVLQGDEPLWAVEEHWAPGSDD
ncbi:hypothetical protein BYI23_E000550 (plasmid) [Burkholderia sp. YI23]|uniref:Uncharacterized protein n=1 Tax=Burkholderia vietnamiensis (strain G4 / LMG 22486) TaxID=269482 RepID=A4JTX1_BURVG|nr:hypothetical protein Bcep1808_6837 [Burkholderia vietnamiensis G4]AET95216.1 hypothetical protein BYI23_E000550 [Burkholderia sp. YI23]